MQAVLNLWYALRPAAIAAIVLVLVLLASATAVLALRRRSRSLASIAVALSLLVIPTMCGVRRSHGRRMFLLYLANHDAIVRSARTLRSEVPPGTLLDGSDPRVPQALRDVEALSIAVLESRVVISVGAGFRHFGLIAHVATDSPASSRRPSTGVHFQPLRPLLDYYDDRP